ncbi:MAG: hypothetical protein JWO17_2494 [Actinomycetia bacterium]|nr:hypothetical protein [Actinomycetes bacterium]
MKKLLIVLAAACVAAPAALAAPSKPVPSLTPRATQKLWRAEVARAKHRPRGLSDATCRSARAVFYAQTDWLRLATRLAQTPSACAQYYVSVPPLASDKTQPRQGQAAQIRALGANFHALAEVSYTGWNGWVGGGNGTWYDAGVLARQRMAAAGFSTSAGDTWAMNELSSAVRTGTGTARRNALDFLHGLANDGVRGVAFTAGVGQPTPDLTTYQVNLQDWLQDTAFWTEVAGYVGDWAQENYGDLRNYAVAGASPQQRRDALVQYVGHQEALANAGPAGAAAARSLLQQAYVPFGNAAWAWPSAYGWTAAPVASMEDFVSGQVYAARAFAAGTGAGVDRLGFAWAPNNTQGLSTADFNTQTDAILVRLAAAIHDSDVPSSDPGAAACAPSWCTTTLDGSAFVSGWQSFATWLPTVPAFSSAPISTTAGTPAGPLTVQLQTSGRADAAPTPRTVTVSSSSATGVFSTAASGPWSTTLTLAIPQGSSSAAFFYNDATAGTPTITAVLDGGASVTQTETVTAPAAPPASLGAPEPQAATATPKPAPKPRRRVVAVTKRFVAGHLVVAVRVASGNARPKGVPVHIRIRRGSSTVANVTRVTAKGGVATWRSAKKLRPGGYVATAAIR